MSEAMVAAAREQVSDRRAAFAHGVRSAEISDFTLVSGTFNLRAGVAEAEWAAYVEERVQELWSHSRRGLAFNLLHDCNLQYAGSRSLYYADARAWHSFARSLAPEAELLVPATRSERARKR
eukprot:1693829-Prymnesium_polylepis.1